MNLNSIPGGSPLPPSTIAPPSTPKLAAITCNLCHNVLHLPIKMICCSEFFCQSCLRTFVAANKSCAGCNLAVDVKVICSASVCEGKEGEINEAFPLYKSFRGKVQHVLEKQWWFDLHSRRTKLTSLRTKLMDIRAEKAEALAELKVAFCNFVKICKKESLLKKTYTHEHKLLEKRQHLAMTAVPLTKDRCEGFKKLPCHTCCLKSLTKHLENALCKGPDVLLVQHSFLEQVYSGTAPLPPCDECGGDLLSPDEYLGGACPSSSEKKPEPDLCELSKSMDKLFQKELAANKTRESSSASSSPALAPAKAPLIPSLTPEGKPRSLSSASASSEIAGLDDVTILKTCAKMFGQAKPAAKPECSISEEEVLEC